MYGTELYELEQLMMLVPNFISKRSGVIIVKELENRKDPIGRQDCNYSPCDCSKEFVGEGNTDKQQSCTGEKSQY